MKKEFYVVEVGNEKKVGVMIGKNRSFYVEDIQLRFADDTIRWTYCLRVRKIDFTRAVISPNDFSIDDHCWSMFFQDICNSIIARGIIALSQKNNNQWIDFTWEDFSIFCGNKATDMGKCILDRFVKVGLLSFDGNAYCVRDEFILFLKGFVNVNCVWGRLSCNS